MLKAGAHQDFGIRPTNLDRTVTVMDVKIQYGHPLHFRQSQRIHRGNGDTVQQTETHRIPRLCMVPRRPDRAKYPFGLA